MLILRASNCDMVVILPYNENITMKLYEVLKIYRISEKYQRQRNRREDAASYPCFPRWRHIHAPLCVHQKQSDEQKAVHALIHGIEIVPPRGQKEHRQADDADENDIFPRLVLPLFRLAV